MPLQKRLYSLGVHKCEWEETFGGLFDRTMAMSRSTVVKTEISPSDLGAHHIIDLDTPTLVCQKFGCYDMSVTALLKDQNDKIILNKFTVYTRETRKWVCYQPAAELNSHCFFFCFFLPPPHTRRLIGNP